MFLWIEVSFMYSSLDFHIAILQYYLSYTGLSLWENSISAIQYTQQFGGEYMVFLNLKAPWKGMVWCVR